MNNQGKTITIIKLIVGVLLMVLAAFYSFKYFKGPPLMRVLLFVAIAAVGYLIYHYLIRKKN